MPSVGTLRNKRDSKFGAFWHSHLQFHEQGLQTHRKQLEINRTVLFQANHAQTLGKQAATTFLILGEPHTRFFSFLPILPTAV
jgi:hypothetical protein